MMQRPRRLANEGARDAVARAGAEPPTAVAGLDLALAARTVARHGGDAHLFAARVAAGLAASAEPPGRDAALDLAALAAWRAGALAFRADALARLGAASGDRLVAAAATLGIAPDAVGAFAHRQRTDRYWWPGREAANGYVCAVGGFSGLGGAWTAPPDQWRALADDGAFAIRSGTTWWRLDADAWGARLTRGGADAPDAAAGAPGVRLILGPDSYLAWLHVRADA